MPASLDDGFEPWATTWLASFASPNTRGSYARDLVVFRGWVTAMGLRPARVTERDIGAFARHCASVGASDATVRRRLAAVSSFYRYVADEWSVGNPVITSARPAIGTGEPPVSLASAEADAVWRAAVALGPRTATLIGLILLDGMKSHELLRLDAGDVSSSGRVVVRRGRAAGEREDRVLDPRTAAMLRRHLGGRREGPLLYGDSPTRPSARLTRHGVDYLVRRTAAHAGVGTHVTVNVLRNTYAER